MATPGSTGRWFVECVFKSNFKRDKLLGVLDVDSTSPDRFSEEDEAALLELAQVSLFSIA